MAGHTNIEWATRSWNAIRGCSRVSSGCEKCYAERQAIRQAGPGEAYDGLVRIHEKGDRREPRWTGKVRFVEELLLEPLRWRAPQRIFVNSMSDLFHERVKTEWVDKILAVMLLAPHHFFLILTKRPERMADYLNDKELYDRVLREVDRIRDRLPSKRLLSISVLDPRRFAPPWIWWGTSIEDDRTACERIPQLQNCRGNLWVSYEPALGPVNLTQLEYERDVDGLDTLDALRGSPRAYGSNPSRRIRWVVVGGESGPGARPFNVAWARAVLTQCRDAGTPCFMKQLGKRPYVSYSGLWGGPLPRSGRCDITGYFPQLRDRKGGDMEEWPADVRVRELMNMVPTAGVQPQQEA